jgi:hypothetical protein
LAIVGKPGIMAFPTGVTIDPGALGFLGVANFCPNLLVANARALILAAGHAIAPARPGTPS